MAGRNEDYFLASLLESVAAFGASPAALLGSFAIAVATVAAVGDVAAGGVVGLVGVGAACGGCSLVQPATATVAKAKTRIVCFISLAPRRTVDDLAYKTVFSSYMDRMELQLP